MKKIMSLVVLLSSIMFAQITQHQSLIELKQQFQSTHPEAFTTAQNKIDAGIIPAAGSERKNAGLAILYSLLLPGMGELYAESYGSGKYFTIADGILWGTFIGFNEYGRWQENNYKAFAKSNGGVDLNGKSADYFANIGGELSVFDYNTTQELKGNFSSVYNTTTSYWKWTSEDQRREYRNMWVSSEQSYTNVRFVVGVLILNRVVSAINAVRAVAIYNKNLKQDVSWNVSVGLDQKPTLPTSVNFNFVTSF